MTSDNPQWFWNASDNPFSPSTTPSWKKYDVEDNKKIEESFAKGDPTVQLKDHVIHIKERMQVHRMDFNRQRPIKREPNK